MSESNRALKCVVWDLDHTVWTGILSEGDRLELRPGMKAAIEELDSRGIVQSCSSRNDPEPALAQLERFGLRDYFLYPEINWNAKSEALRRIAIALNIGIDTLAFVDDSPYERAEVAHHLPEVVCFDATEIDGLLHSPRVTASAITPEGASRRLLYQNEIRRQELKKTLSASEVEFQRQLQIEVEVFVPEEFDLARASELTQRTHQLNTSGVTYSEEELRALIKSPTHRVVMTRMRDRFGSHGSVGLAVMEVGEEKAMLNLLLISCRMMSYGVGVILLTYLMRWVQHRGLRFQVRFVPTEKNRMMYTTYRFSGFKTVEKREGGEILEHDLQNLRPMPEHIAFREIVEVGQA